MAQTPSVNARRGARGAALAPVALLAAAMVSMQFGAAFAKGLFPRVGPEGAVALRLAFSGLMLGVATRPWRGLVLDRRLWPLIGYGVSLGAMNTLFYMALARIPLGVAMALEFVGPLGLALAGSRRAGDFAWIALATAGLLALLPLGRAAHGVDPAGAALALGSGGAWALYILLGRRAGAVHGARAAALGLIIAAAVFAPLGVALAGPALFDPGLIPAGALLALLSSALPYSLEMVVLTRIPARVFSVLMSLEPALGALAGLVLLHEVPSAAQAAGIAAVVVASLGCALTSRPRGPSPPSPEVGRDRRRSRQGGAPPP